MPYIYKRIHTKHRDFVTRTKCYYVSRGEKKRRGVRIAPTGEGKKKRNAHQAYLRNKYQIYNNFDIGDMWITLTYRNSMLPENIDAAHKNLMDTLSKLRKKLKRKSITLMYFVKTETGEQGRVHHHLIIKNNFPVVSYLYEYWKEYGSVRDFKEIYNLANGKLVGYMLGQPDEYNDDRAAVRFSHSRNLVMPEVETRIYPADSFRENPKPPKCSDEGKVWVIENLNNWYPDIDGYIYQEYELVLKEVHNVKTI